MSRPRLRPTRDETRARLFAAAAEVFSEHGVGGSTVEQIASAAGFTRGAFYSNFESKEELLIAMLEDHVEWSLAHNRELLAEHPDTLSFVEALRDDRGRGDDPLHRHQLLQIELILHVARTQDGHPALAERLATMRSLIGDIVVSTLRAAGVEREIDPNQAGALLLAIEDGFRLHRLIDPASTPPDAFHTALRFLQELLLETRPAPSHQRSSGS